MQAAADVQLLGYLQGVYSEGPRQMVFNDEKKWQSFCLNVLKMTNTPSCDFSKRDIHIICFNVRDTGNNYIGMKRWHRDLKTNELFIQCCHVIEEYSTVNMGFVKLVVAVPLKAKVNLIWLENQPPHRHDEQLNEIVSKQKAVGDELGDYRFLIGHMEHNYVMSDVTFLRKEMEALKKTQEDLREQSVRIRLLIKERLAGSCLNK